MLNKEKTITISLDEYNRLLESQKQVDELKSENTELYKEHTTLIAGSILEKQNTVKDTAKNILSEVGELILYHNGRIDIPDLYTLAERYGVEVE